MPTLKLAVALWVLGWIMGDTSIGAIANIIAAVLVIFTAFVAVKAANVAYAHKRSKSIKRQRDRVALMRNRRL